MKDKDRQKIEDWIERNRRYPVTEYEDGWNDVLEKLLRFIKRIK